MIGWCCGVVCVGRLLVYVSCVLHPYITCSSHFDSTILSKTVSVQRGSVSWLSSAARSAVSALSQQSSERAGGDEKMPAVLVEDDRSSPSLSTVVLSCVARCVGAARCSQADEHRLRARLQRTLSRPLSLGSTCRPTQNRQLRPHILTLRLCCPSLPIRAPRAAGVCRSSGWTRAQCRTTSVACGSAIRPTCTASWPSGRQS